MNTSPGTGAIWKRQAFCPRGRKMSEVNEIVEARRKGFEEWMAAGAGVELWKVVAARSGDGGYALKEMNIAWDGWNAALDSVCVELPPEWPPVCEKDEGANEMRNACIDAIELSGLKVKP